MKTDYENKFIELKDHYKKESRATKSRTSPCISTAQGIFGCYSRKIKKIEDQPLDEIERTMKMAMECVNALERKIFNLEYEANLGSAAVSQGGLDRASIIEQLHHEKVRKVMTEVIARHG